MKNALKRSFDAIIRPLKTWVGQQSKVYLIPNRHHRQIYRQLIINASRDKQNLAFLGWNVTYIDPRSLYFMLKYQFFEGWNDFHTEKPQPYILDCGANIGISVLRFKQLYPNARIIAFEPDQAIFKVLQRNMSHNRVTHVELVQAAIWTQVGEIEFISDGALGGHLTSAEVQIAAPGTRHMVNTVGLADYLTEPIDLLKLDIEGAELPVLKSCVGRLHHIEKIIVEVHHNVDRPEVTAEILAILAEAGFRVSINSDWRLIYLNPPYQRSSASDTFDQYLVVCGWR